MRVESVRTATARRAARMTRVLVGSASVSAVRRATSAARSGRAGRSPTRRGGANVLRPQIRRAEAAVASAPRWTTRSPSRSRAAARSAARRWTRVQSPPRFTISSRSSPPPSEEAQHECVARQHRAVDHAARCATRRPDPRVAGAADRDAARRPPRALPFGEIELAALERARVGGIGQPSDRARRRARWETASGTRPARCAPPRRVPARGPQSTGTASTPRTPVPGTASACPASAAAAPSSRATRPGLVIWCIAQAANRVRHLVVVLEIRDERAGSRSRPGVPRGWRCQL